MQGPGVCGWAFVPTSRVPSPPALNFIHPLTVEELRLDTEELLLSMRSNEGQRPAVSSSSSAFCRISGSAWFWGDPTSGE